MIIFPVPPGDLILYDLRQSVARQLLLMSKAFSSWSESPESWDRYFDVHTPNGGLGNGIPLCLRGNLGEILEFGHIEVEGSKYTYIYLVVEWLRFMVAMHPRSWLQ